MFANLFECLSWSVEIVNDSMFHTVFYIVSSHIEVFINAGIDANVLNLKVSALRWSPCRVTQAESSLL